MRKPALVLSSLSLLVAVGCGKSDDAQPTPSPSPSPTATASPDPSPSPSPEAPKVIKVEGFQTPESVLYDDQADVYLVSNINGSPFAKDDNGFISRVTPDGKLAEPAWIDGKNEKVTLDAPKGMAFIDDVLYVSDIDVIRMFDRKTGEAKGEIAIPKSTFMNDLAAGENKTLYASDSGLAEGFKPSGTAAIWAIAGGKPKKMIGGDELGAPNGLAAQGDAVWVCSFGSGEVYRVTADGKRDSVSKAPKGALDGLVLLPDGTLLVSSWEGQAVYHGKPDALAEAIGGVKSPADIGWDSKRNLVLIPGFETNTVEIHPLPPAK